MLQHGERSGHVLNHMAVGSLSISDYSIARFYLLFCLRQISEYLRLRTDVNFACVQFKKYTKYFFFFSIFQEKKVKIIHLQDMINNNFDLNFFLSLTRLTKEYFQHLFCIYGFIRSDVILGGQQSILNLPDAYSL